MIDPYVCEDILLTDASGNFTSPGYPDNYPALMDDCTWTVRVPEGSRIKLEVDALVSTFTGDG